AVGPAQARHVAGELNDSQLHAQADAQERGAAFTCVADGADLPFGAPLAEAARHENGVQAFQAGGAFLFDDLGIKVFDVHTATGVDAGVGERFRQRLVRFGEIDI